MPPNRFYCISCDGDGSVRARLMFQNTVAFMCKCNVFSHLPVTVISSVWITYHILIEPIRCSIILISLSRMCAYPWCPLCCVHFFSISSSFFFSAFLLLILLFVLLIWSAIQVSDYVQLQWLKSIRYSYAGFSCIYMCVFLFCWCTFLSFCIHLHNGNISWLAFDHCRHNCIDLRWTVGYALSSKYIIIHHVNKMKGLLFGGNTEPTAKSGLVTGGFDCM